MSTFAVLVRRLVVTPHPDAELLELAQIGGYQAVVGKGQFRTGDLAAYVPEAALLPADLIETLGLTGRLAGPESNRVHAIRLRGVLSQGLCLVARPEWMEGQDVTAELRITKHVPPIPDDLLGQVRVLEPDEVLKFDVEDIKAFPHVFQEGEPVVFTEKLHGTFMMAVGLPARLARHEDGAHPSGRFIVSSKGLMHQRLGFQHVKENDHNIYLRTAERHHLPEKLMGMAEAHDAAVFALGEVVGGSLQDLAYGQPGDALAFRVFAMAVGKRFLDDADLEEALQALDLKRTTVLYRGPFNADALALHTTGKETLSGRQLHMREGVVVTPMIERHDPAIGRAMLRSISPDYLLRKGGTEFS